MHSSFMDSAVTALTVPYNVPFPVILTFTNGSYAFSPSELRLAFGDALDFELPPDVPGLEVWRSHNPCLDGKPSPIPKYFPAQAEQNIPIVRVQVNTSEDFYFSPRGLSLCGPEDVFTLLSAVGFETSTSLDSTTTTKIRLTSTMLQTTTKLLPGGVQATISEYLGSREPRITSTPDLTSSSTSNTFRSLAAWGNHSLGNYTASFRPSISYWGSASGFRPTKAPSVYPPISSSAGVRSWPSRSFMVAMCYIILYSLV